MAKMSSQRRGFRKLWPRSGASSASDPSQPTVASLVRHSPKPSLAKIGTDGKAFKIAWMKFLDRLPSEERKAFIDAYTSITPDYLVQEISNLDRKDSLSAARRLVNPTKDFLTILDQLLATTSSFASLGIPDAPSVIIGGARLIIKMVLNYVEFFEKLTDMLRKLTVHLAHLREASKLERMVLIQESTANVYVGILKFYHQAYSIFKNRDRQEHTLGHIRRFGRVQWEPFKAAFGEIEREIQDSLEALSQAKGTEALHRISNLQDESTKHTQILSEQQRHNYLEVISFVDFDPIQRSNLKKRWPGTGDWLLNHTRFQQWFLGKGSQILWCHGQPGAGKSVLSSIVVDYIKKHKNADTENVGNAFIYFRYDNMEANSPERMIAAILKQMSAQLESFPKDLVDLLSRCYRNAEVPSPEESIKAIIALSSCLTQTFVVMDALDECKEESRGPIFELISALTTKIPSAKFFITSRPEPRIRDDLDTLRTQNFEIEVAETRNDIAEYVKGQLEYLTGPVQPAEPRKRRRLCAIKDQTKDEIFRTLTRRADGVFLWVDLQFDSICQQRNDEDILEVLSSLPEGLYNTYERILEQIKKESKPLQRLASKCLMWVLKAKRKTFRVEWLLCAIATDSDFTTFGQILAKHEKYTRQEILDACHNLLAIVGSIVSPVHYSLAEFIELEKTIKDSAFAELQDQQLMEARMAKTCLVFLKLYHSDGPVMWLKKWDKRFSFYEYCAQYFDQHVIAAGKERFEDVREHLYSLLSMEASALGSIASNRRGCSVEEATAKDFIYITQLYELSAVTEDERWNTQALHQSTLSAACATGPVGKVRTLLDFKAIPVLTHHSPLQAAVLNHQGREMVELLLDSGVADVNEPFKDHTILEEACAVSSIEVVETLLSHGAKGIEGDSTFSRAFDIAARWERQDTARVLLNMPVDSTSKTLGIAVFFNSEKLVHSMLEKGVDPNFRTSITDNEFHPSKLYVAAYYGHTEIVRHLLHFGAEVDVGGEFGTALHAAAFGGSLPTVKVLLEHGADVDAYEGVVETPLTISAFMGHADMTKALLDAGADVNKGCQTSLLHEACHGGDLDLVRSLICRGANINEQRVPLQLDQRLVPTAGEMEEEGVRRTALEATFAGVFTNEKLEIAKLLIDNGADVNANSEAGTALIAACLLRTNSKGLQSEVIKLVLARGAEANASAGGWTSALEAAASKTRDEGTVKLLLSAHFSQAQMDVALEAAVYEGSANAVRTLLDHGALPREGQEASIYFWEDELALPRASFAAKAEVVDALIAAGEDVDEPDRYGSPLESALLQLHFTTRNNKGILFKRRLAATIVRLRKANAVEPSDDSHIGILCQGPLCNRVVDYLNEINKPERVSPREHWINGVRYQCDECESFNYVEAARRGWIPTELHRYQEERQETEKKSQRKIQFATNIKPGIKTKKKSQRKIHFATSIDPSTR